MPRDNIICVVNRTEAPIEYVFNGVQCVLEPGENHIRACEVEKAKTQNIVMGTEDPGNPSNFISLVGIKAKDPKKQRDDISPIVFQKDEQKRVHALFEDGTDVIVGIERIDRRQLGQELQGAIVRNRIPLRRSEIDMASINDAGAGALGG